MKERASYYWEQEMVYDFSNFLLFDALRAEIAEGKISLDNICFSVDDKPLEVNRFGACPNYPKQGEFRYSERVLIATMHKRKEEDESRMMDKYGYKTLKEVYEAKQREKEENSQLAQANTQG